MADIVHSSGRHLLVRKIGYSAGLENTRARLALLVDMYSTEHQITDTDWTNLVQQKYRRDAKLHFENFFKVINVLRREQGRLVALPTLEALTILRKLLPAERELFDAAIDPILLFALTLADGELLGNLMCARFISENVEDQLSIYREAKLQYFYNTYKNENDRRELHRCIDFKELPKPKKKDARPKGPFADTRLLEDEGQKGPFTSARQLENEDPYDFRVSLSDDWYKKVPGRRESWARDLGLWSEGGCTDRGTAYLSLLRSFLPKGIAESRAAILMPTDLEFSANYLTWELGLEDLVSFDKLLTGIGQLFIEDSATPFDLSEAELVQLVRKTKELFSANDLRFSRIRKELPLTIFALVLLGLSVSRGTVCPSPSDIVERFQASKTDVLVRKSRNSLYSFSLTNR